MTTTHETAPAPGAQPAVRTGRLKVFLRAAPGVGKTYRMLDEAHDRERAFEPFQRLGDRDNIAGLGLGLALARGLTEAMDGTLTPEDTPGGGLTMVLSLPVAGAPAEQL